MAGESRSRVGKRFSTQNTQGKEGAQGGEGWEKKTIELKSKSEQAKRKRYPEEIAKI